MTRNDLKPQGPPHLLQSLKPSLASSRSSLPYAIHAFGAKGTRGRKTDPYTIASKDPWKRTSPPSSAWNIPWQLRSTAPRPTSHRYLGFTVNIPPRGCIQPLPRESLAMRLRPDSEPRATTHDRFKPSLSGPALSPSRSTCRRFTGRLLPPLQRRWKLVKMLLASTPGDWRDFCGINPKT